MIIYFTGTGNSRFAAEKIAELTGDRVVDSADYIRENKSAEFKESGPYIFVAPVYASAPPVDFMEFIRRSVFPHNTKAYFILTAAGSMTASPAFCKKLAREKGFWYMGSDELIMPQNYIHYFKMGTEEVNRKKLEGTLEKIPQIVDKIIADEPFEEKKVNTLEYGMIKAVLKGFYRFMTSTKKFRVTEKCIECGKCEQLCPLGNITMESGRPIWGRRCTHCTACINLCPVEAIEFGSKTEVKERYHGPESLLKGKGE